MWFDVGFGVLFLIGAYRGFRIGFAQQMLQLTGLGLGLLFADPLARKLLPMLEKHLLAVPKPLHHPMLFLAVMFLIWLIITVPGSIYLAAYRKKVFGSNEPSLGDRAFGLGVGLAKAGLMAAFLVFTLNHLPKVAREHATFKEHYDKSRVVSAANRAQLIEQILATPEAQRLGDHLCEILRSLLPEEEKKPEPALAEEAQELIPKMARKAEKLPRL